MPSALILPPWAGPRPGSPGTFSIGLDGAQYGSVPLIAQIWDTEVCMSRIVRDASLESRTARSRLKPRGRPYYRALEPGLLHLGYRRPLAGAGKWLARHYVGDGTYRLHKIGIADDLGGTISCTVSCLFPTRPHLGHRSAGSLRTKIQTTEGGMGGLASAQSARPAIATTPGASNFRRDDSVGGAGDGVPQTGCRQGFHSSYMWNTPPERTNGRGSGRT